MKKYGCFNRNPFKPWRTLHGINSETGEHIRIEIPFVNSIRCQYTHTALGQNDPGCKGCVWKSKSGPKAPSQAKEVIVGYQPDKRAMPTNIKPPPKNP